MALRNLLRDSSDEEEEEEMVLRLSSSEEEDNMDLDSSLDRLFEGEEGEEEEDDDTEMEDNGAETPIRRNRGLDVRRRLIYPSDED